MAEKFYRRFGSLICVLVMISLPPLAYGAVSAYLNQQNNIADWLPRESTAVDDLVWFAERFGSDEVLVASWPQCTLEDERLDKFAAALMEPVQVVDQQRPQQLFRHVFSGRETLQELTSDPANLQRDQAIARMRGWLVGPDGQSTCAVALVTKEGEANRPAAVEAIFRAAEASGLARDEIRVGGSTADSVAVNEASQRWMIELIIVAGIWGMVAAWLCLKSMRLVSVVMLTTAWAWTASLSIVYWSGFHMDAVLMMMPVLVYVLSVSGAVHLTNYYRDAVRTRDRGEALDWAYERGLRPCTFSCATTAIGLGSLMVSHVWPIQRFGFFAATGVIVVLFSLLVIWPALMHRWADGLRQQTDDRAGTDQHRTFWWRPIYNFVGSQYVPVVAVTLVLMPILAYNTTLIRTSARLEDLLSQESPLIQGYQSLQESIGPLVPVEVVLRFGPRDPKDSLELVNRLHTVEGVRRSIEAMPNAGGTIAATTFIEELPRGGAARQVMQRRITARRVQRNYDQLTKLRFVFVDQQANQELWRISARVAAFSDVDYGEFLEDLKQNVDDQLAASDDPDATRITSIVCGGAPLVYMAQEQLLDDLFRSFGTALVLIAITMIVITRSVFAGLLAMIPNLFPTAAVFGAIGFIEMPIGMGVMMTASAALGIAVDDTLHFLVWFRRGTVIESDRKQAVLYAFRHCATPMLQTTLICGIGMLVFALSPFVPIQRFAQFMALLLFAALAGDLVVLPAMLISFIGRSFSAKRSETKPTDSVGTTSGRDASGERLVSETV